METMTTNHLTNDANVTSKYSGYRKLTLAELADIGGGMEGGGGDDGGSGGTGGDYGDSGAADDGTTAGIQSEIASMEQARAHAEMCAALTAQLVGAITRPNAGVGPAAQYGASDCYGN
jgi:hypothetical protein